MGISYGPSIATSGLIFHYDMGNTSKSFKGKPTTNYNPDPFFSDIPTHWDYFGFGDTNTIATSTDYLPAIGSGVIAKMTVDTGQTAATLVHRDPSGWGNLTNGDQVTVSFYVRGVANSVGKLVHIHGFANSAGGAISTGTDNSFNGVNIGTLTSEWKRYSHTFTWTDAVNNSYTDQFYGYVRVEGLSAGDVFYASNPQTEKNSFATPFVDGTRSNTQAIVDLTGNRTVTATSLDYNNNNTFQFDGTNDYVSISPIFNPYNSSYTLEAWIKRDATGRTDGIMSDPQYNWLMFWVTPGNKLVWQHGYYDPGETRTSLTSATDISTDWTHVVVSFENGVGAKLYVNGKLDATGTNGNPFGLTGSRGVRFIGTIYNDVPGGTNGIEFDGKISIARMYSKALAEAEVAQNFNASRARFGI